VEGADVPIIPTSADIKRRIPTGQAPVAVVSNPGAIGQALAQVGQGISAAGQTIEKTFEKRDNFAAARAEADYVSALDKLDKEAELDNDHETLSERYTKRAEELRNEFGAKLKSPFARQKFNNDTQTLRDRASTRFGFVAEKKWRQSEIDTLKLKSEELGDVAANGDIESAAGAYNKMVDALYETGAIDNEAQVEMLKDQFADDAITRRASTLKGSQLMEFLDSPLAQRLPADKREQLREAGRTKYTQEESLRIIDEFEMRRVPMAERTMRINEIAKKDPVLAEQIRTDTAQRAARIEAARNRASAQMYDSLVPAFMDPDPNKRMTLRDLTPDQRRTLGSAMTSLQSVEKSWLENNTPFGKYTDPALTTRLLEMNRKRDWVGIRTTLGATPSTKITETDFEKWMKVGIDGGGAGAVKPYFDAQEIFKRQMKSAKIKEGDPRYTLYESRFAEWYDRQVALGGKVDDKAALVEINRLMVERDITPGSSWNPKNWGGNVTQAEIEGGATAWATISKNDPEAASALDRSYPNSSEVDKVRIYRNAMGLDRE
jgi:hypothetical protein